MTGPVKSRSLTGARLAAFVSPQFSLAMISLPVLLYTVPLYSGELKLGLVAIGGALSLARVWDLVTEPMIGMLTDRLPLRWGRRRPWMVLAAPFLMAGIYLLFVPPAGLVSPGYVLACLITIFTAWTFFNLSHVSWGGELFTDYDHRTRIYGWLMFAFLIGTLGCSIVPAVANKLTGIYTTSHTTLMLTAVIVVAVPLSAGLAVWAVGEPAAPPPARMKWGASLKAILANNPLARLMFTNFGEGLAGGATIALIVFFGQSKLGLDIAAVQMMLLINFGAALVAVPLWMRLAYRIGKHRALAVSAILNCLFGPLILFVPSGQFWLSAVVYALLGANFGATPSLIRAIATDTVDVDRLETGEQRTALYLSIISMANKVGFAIPPILTASVLAWAGFTPSAGAANSAWSLGWLTAMYVGLPVVANAAITAVMWGFPLDADRQAQVRAELARRDAAAAPAGPAPGAVSRAPGPDPAVWTAPR
jgi:Na+/melibiose symporter-like transporter